MKLNNKLKYYQKIAIVYNMKKTFIYTLLLSTLLLTQQSYAGVNEDKVIKLITDIQSSENANLSADIKGSLNFSETIKQIGKKDIKQFGKVNLISKIDNKEYDSIREESKIEGVIKIDMHDFISLNLPFAISADTKDEKPENMYIYIYPEYEQYAQFFMGINTQNGISTNPFAQYTNKWIKINFAELEKKLGMNATSTTALFTDKKEKEKINTLLKTVKWFTTKPKKLKDGRISYDIKINPKLFSAEFTNVLGVSSKTKKKTAKEIQEMKEVENILKNIKFEIIEKNGKLNAVNMAFNFNESKKTTEKE